jgi:hypothetical protein
MGRQSYRGPEQMETITPTELAIQIGGQAEGYSRSRGAREVRRIARKLFPLDAPGKGREWHLTPEQASAIRRRIEQR